jgi:RimJ/RimL family protein N-acetyltransferase
MWADPVTVRYLSGTPSTEQQSWMRLLTFCGLWPMLGFGYWAVEEKHSGAYVGQVGFADFRRELDPSIIGAPEIGWVLASAFSGRGYASEAAHAALAWGDANLRAARTVCIVAPANVASLRVAEKCGYREFARTTFLDGPITLFERRRSSGA